MKCAAESEHRFEDDNPVVFAYIKTHRMQYNDAVCDLQAKTLRQCVRPKVKADLYKILLVSSANH